VIATMMQPRAYSSATWPSVEMLRFDPMSTRTRQIFDALAAAAGALGIPLSVTDRYRGTEDVLLLWGAGDPARFEPIRRQLASGGHCLAWDLSYWDRARKARVSFDGPHPQQWVMVRDWPADRFAADRVTVEDAWDPQGPILVAGIGPKATTEYGQDVVLGWERAQIARCLARWDRPIRYRYKKARGLAPLGTVLDTSGSIDDALRGASLVITWHSNVAVDAIRLGIPVVCREGAAAAVCPSDVSETHRPLPVDIRDRFLANLAWFQWDVRTEAAACWRWVREMLA
jgi:hypothetical protein